MTETNPDTLVARLRSMTPTVTGTNLRLLNEAADRIEVLEACLRCDDESVRTAWAREAALREAVETFVGLYRAQYKKPSTHGLRSTAPMREQVAALNAAAIRKQSRHSPDRLSGANPQTVITDGIDDDPPTVL